MKRGWQTNKRFQPTIEKTLRRLPAAAKDGAQDALRTNGAEAVRIISGDAPDGRIEKSVQWGFHSDPETPKLRSTDARVGDIVISIWAGGKKAPHAHLVHFGTGKRTTKSGANRGAVTNPRPFFWPNIRSLRRRHRGRISRKVNKALRASVRR